jgi:hypothetical protein
LQLPERKEKQQWSDSRSKRRRKKGGGGGGKKTERIKTALAEALRLSSAPNNGFGIRKTVQRKDVQRGRMRDTTMAQKLSARSSRLRARRRDEDDGGDDVRTFSSAFSRLPFLCDVGNFFLKNNFKSLYIFFLNHIY